MAPSTPFPSESAALSEDEKMRRIFLETLPDFFTDCPESILHCTKPAKTEEIRTKTNPYIPIPSSVAGKLSTNAILHPPTVDTPNPETQSLIDIRTLPFSQRSALATGRTISIWADDSTSRPVMPDMRHAAITAMSPVAHEQRRRVFILLTNCSRPAILAMCYFTRDVVTKANPPTEPRTGPHLCGAIDVYHAGCAMGMDVYLGPLRARLLREMGERKEEVNVWFLEKASQLGKGDPVLRRAVEVAAEMGKEFLWREGVGEWMGRHPRFFRRVEKMRWRARVAKLHEDAGYDEDPARIGWT